MQYKDLVQPFKNKRWGTYSGDGHDAICQSSGPLENSEKNFGMIASNCSGHHWYDLTFWKLVHETEDGKWIKKHKTNVEVSCQPSLRLKSHA